MSRSPECVFSTFDAGLADIVAAWLSGHEIDARVVNRTSLGGLLRLTPFPVTSDSAPGIEVWVADPSLRKRAVELLVEQTKFDLSRRSRLPEGTLQITCEECDEAVTFHARLAGTVQDCPRCGAYIDVPDPYADDSEIDY